MKSLEIKDPVLLKSPSFSTETRSFTHCTQEMLGSARVITAELFRLKSFLKIVWTSALYGLLRVSSHKYDIFLGLFFASLKIVFIVILRFSSNFFFSKKRVHLQDQTAVPWASTNILISRSSKLVYQVSINILIAKLHTINCILK